MKDICYCNIKKCKFQNKCERYLQNYDLKDNKYIEYWIYISQFKPNKTGCKYFLERK